jgi:heme/copper-type cytochrome/quinol oxidase subunit 1
MAPDNELPEKLPLSRGQIILRIFGGALLTACALMVVLGLTVLERRLHGIQFVVYWTWCLLLTFGAIILALGDMLLVRRTLNRTRRELFEREFMNRNFPDRSRKKENR